MLSNPRSSTGPDGTVVAVWARSEGKNEVIQSATQPPGGEFGAPEDLSATDTTGDQPRVAIGPDGTMTVVWSNMDGFSGFIQAATRPPGGSFGVPVNLSAADSSLSDAGIAIAADGTTTVIWREPVGAHGVIKTATRKQGGSFEPPVDLSDSGKDAYLPQISVAPGGTATAVWVSFTGTSFLVQAATRPPGGDSVLR